MVHFRIIGTKGQTEWLNAEEWSIDDIELITADYPYLFGDDWQLEFK